MERLNVLLATGILTAEHQGRLITRRLQELLEATGRFHVNIVEEFRNITPAYLEPYDLIFVDYDGKTWPTDDAVKFGEQTDAAVFDFVSKGKGIVIYHSSIWADDWSDEWRKMMGGYCLMSAGGRRCPKDDFYVETTDENHPITKDIDKKWMSVFDDLFSQVIVHPEAQDFHVLASVFDDVEFYRIPGFPPPHHPVEIPDGKLENMPGVNAYTPVIWTNTYGKGRVFVSSLGHWEALDRFNFITMLVRGAEWAATGEVTLERPNRKGDNRLKLFPYY